MSNFHKTQAAILEDLIRRDLDAILGSATKPDEEAMLDYAKAVQPYDRRGGAR